MVFFFSLLDYGFLLNHIIKAITLRIIPLPVVTHWSGHLAKKKKNRELKSSHEKL